MTREQEARESFLKCVERERVATKLQFCNFDDGLGRVTWRAQIDTLVLQAMSMAPQRRDDDVRRRLRDALVQLAGGVLRAAQDLGVEDEIPF